MDKREELTQIVKKVQSDKGQFELLYSHIITRVYFWCYTIIGNEAEAKDVTQEVMIRIYNKIDTVGKPEYFSSWMYRLARNYCINYLRDHRKNEFEYLLSDNFNESTELLVKEERSDHMPNEAYDLKETKNLIAQFIDKLPIKQKDAIVLYYLEEMTIGEVADVLECNEGTVKSRLHKGRKQLEKQINEYQTINRVKLYSIALIPMLGLILREYRDELCDKQDLHYNKDMYKPTKLTNMSKLANLISNNILMLSVAVVSIIVVGVLSYVMLQPSDDTLAEIGFETSFIDDMELFNKANSNPYIDTISYYTFPTRDNLDIVIELKKDLNEQDIQILYDNKEVDFEKTDNILTLQVTKNGRYTISIKNKSVSFEISNIDKHAPELIEVHNYGNYLQLQISDEMSQVDYGKSYVEYNGEKYNINNLEMKGNFVGEIIVVLYVDDNHYMKYFVDTY